MVPEVGGCSLRNSGVRKLLSSKRDQICEVQKARDIGGLVMVDTFLQSITDSRPVPLLCERGVTPLDYPGVQNHARVPGNAYFVAEKWMSFALSHVRSRGVGGGWGGGC